MPGDERAAVKGAERCATHPTRGTVATCAVCGRPLCMECAIPVRGLVLGIECLQQVLGDEPTPPQQTPRWRRRTVRAPLDRASGWLLGIAVFATLLPWTRFSTGSGFAGAWALDRRWSMVVAVAGPVAFAVWLASGHRPMLARASGTVGGAIVAAGSLMAILNPPPFTKPALAPWIALVAGVGAAVSGVMGARKGTRARV